MDISKNFLINYTIYCINLWIIKNFLYLNKKVNCVCENCGELDAENEQACNKSILTNFIKEFIYFTLFYKIKFKKRIIKY